MSAFDNLKLAMIPTAWKEDKLYSAIPEQTNTERLLVQNPPSEVTWDGTTATSTGLGGIYYFNITPSYGVHAGLTYELTVTATLSSGTAITIYATSNQSILLQNGTHTYTFVHDGANNTLVRLRVAPDNGFTLTNMSLIEKTTGDFTVDRGTTGTRVYSSGLLQTITDTDAPRLDYTGGGAPSVLLEPQRKNFTLNSNNPAMMNYNGGAGTLGFSSTLSSPDGSNTNSMELNPDGTSSQFWVGMGGQRYDTMTASTVYTISCFVNYDNYRYVRYGGIFGSERAIFDLEQETVVSQEANVISARVEPYYQNWKRVIVKYTFQDQVGNGTPYIVLQAMSNSISHIHSPAPTLPMHSYGWQVEEASYPTSYIATSGTAATRSRDIINNGGVEETFNLNEGTLYFHGKVDDDYDGLGFLRLRSRDAKNWVEFYFQSSNFFIREKVNNTFGASNSLGGNYIKGEFFKFAVTYNKNGTRKGYQNGTQMFSATNSGDFTSNISGLRYIGFDGATLGLDVKGVYYFDRALTDAELASLTT